MDRLVDFAKEDGKDVGAGFKFLFDVDGNAWTSRFRRLLLTESVILKSTICKSLMDSSSASSFNAPCSRFHS
jgi:hypothetical protein